MFKNSVRLFDIFGFCVKVHPTWLVIAALIVWSLTTGYFPQILPGLSRLEYIAISIASMLGMFFSLILHELSHSLVARQFGLNVGGITLFLFGGVAELEQEPVSAKSEFWIAIAGPVLSFAIAGIAFLAIDLGGSEVGASPLMAVIGYLGLINIILAVFNLVPAFPLDGGRVLRALIWYLSGDLLKATRIASKFGTGFGFLLITVGMLSLFSNFSIGGLWLILIGFFILSASRSSYQQLLIRKVFGGKTVAGLMSRKPVTANAGMTIADLIENVMLKHNVSFVPIVKDDHLLGFVDAGSIHEVDRDRWAFTILTDILVAVDENNTVSSNVPVDELFKRMALTGQRKFLVEDDSRLIGVVTLSDLMNYLAIMQGLDLEDNPNLRPARNSSY